MKIIQLSDTHLLEKNGSLFGIDPWIRLKKAFESIRKLHSDASFVVITGDIANSGETEAYKRLKEFLQDYSDINIHFILGNHDKKSEFDKFFDDFKGMNFAQSVKIYDNKAFIFLDSRVEGEEYGVFCDERLRWIKENIEANQDKDIYLFMHHFPLVSGINWMDIHANFRAKDRFFSLLEPYSNIKHIFCGHLHRNILAKYNNIFINCSKSTTFQVAYNPNSFDDYLTNEEKPSYAVAILKDNEMVINFHEFLDEDLIYPGEQW